jgi:hypothetical protein
MTIMKIQSAITGAFLMVISMTAFGQKFEVPQAVKSAFEQKVPNAEEVEWDFDEDENRWEVEYKIGEDEYESAFDRSADWMETEREMDASELPESIASALDKDYPGYELSELDYVLTPEGEFYEVEIEWEKDGAEEEAELLYTLEGIIVKEE